MNSQRSVYKDHLIVITWFDAGQFRRSPGTEFNASFNVIPRSRDKLCWQVFPRDVFPTLDAAIANALALAKESVELALANA